MQSNHIQARNNDQEKQRELNNIPGIPSRNYMEKREKEASTTCSSPLSGLSVFIVDDEFINRHMLSAFLTRFGAQVMTFNNGQELLNAMDTDQPDIILMDIRMPVMNGLEATREIRGAEVLRGEKKQVPIIAFTAHGSPGFKELCFSVGMDAYLQKATDSNVLLDVILSCYSKKQIVLPV